MARILVVEDTHYVQYVIEKCLSAEGYQVDVAKDGLEALESLLKNPIDLLVLDLHLPGLDGFQILRRLQTTKPKLPFIVMSGFIEDDVEQRLMKLGAAYVFSKPVDTERLVDAVERTLRPARRILLVTTETSSVRGFVDRLGELGYLVEIQSKIDRIPGQILHRAFDALFVWGDWPYETEIADLCRQLRAAGEWLPVFWPAAELEGITNIVDLIAVSEEDLAGDPVYARLADRIGLQRDSIIRNIRVIQLAGHIDRDDIIETTIREAMKHRQNILIDFRNVKYLGPYVQKVLWDLSEEAEPLHIRIGLLGNLTSLVSSTEKLDDLEESLVCLFSDEQQALKALDEK